MAGDRKWCKPGTVCSLAQPHMFIKVVRRMAEEWDALQKAQAGRPGQTATPSQPFSFLQGGALRSQARCFPRTMQRPTTGPGAISAPWSGASLLFCAQCFYLRRGL